MLRLVDIHTHSHLSSEDIIAVRNLSLTEAERFNASESSIVSVGVHPWDIGDLDDSWLVQLKKACTDKHVALVGECGLDKNIETSLEMQTDIFLRHVFLAETIKKPLIIHCVGYYNELITLRKQNKPAQRWIVHGFRGKPQLALQLLEAGLDLSFGEKFNTESIIVTPIERIFIETDESFLPIRNSYEKIADIKNSTVQALNAGRNLLSSYFG